MTIDDLLEQMRLGMAVEAEAEHEVLEEMRGHLEDSVAAARARGAGEREALEEAAAAFGVELTAAEMRATHAGWGTGEGIAAAALPVIFALVLRWLIFAPGGTFDAWRQVLSWPSLGLVTGVMILLPLLRFPRRGYAISLWLFFLMLSIAAMILPTARW